MSIQAMVWAIKDAPVDTAQEAMILTAMADQSNDDGTEFRRSMKWLAPRSRCSVSSLHRHMKRMEARGVIRRGDQSLARGPKGRIPVVWDLAMEMRRPPIDDGEGARTNVGQDGRGVRLTDVVGHWCDTSSVTGDREENPALNPALTPSCAPAAPAPTTEPDAPKAQRRTSVPDALEITDAMRAWAAAKAPDVGPVDHEQFLDHHRAKGSRMVDWTAAWRTWMTNAQRWTYSKPGSRPQAQKNADGLETLTREQVALLKRSYR